MVKTSLPIADFIFQLQKLLPQFRQVERAHLLPVCQNSLDEIVLAVGFALQICLALWRLRVHWVSAFFVSLGHTTCRYG